MPDIYPRNEQQQAPTTLSNLDSPDLPWNKPQKSAGERYAKVAATALAVGIAGEANDCHKKSQAYPVAKYMRNYYAWVVLTAVVAVVAYLVGGWVFSLIAGGIAASFALSNRWDAKQAGKLAQDLCADPKLSVNERGSMKSAGHAGGITAALRSPEGIVQTLVGSPVVIGPAVGYKITEAIVDPRLSANTTVISGPTLISRYQTVRQNASRTRSIQTINGAGLNDHWKR